MEIALWSGVIVFVQQLESGAEFYFMVAGQMKGFPPLGLDKQ